MARDYDAGYKLLFAMPEMMRDLLREFIRSDWLRALDYSTLERVSGNYVADNMRQRASDMVWRVDAGDPWGHLYVLLEFHSTIDRYMAPRMAAYTALLHQELVRAGQVLPDRRVPAALSIVLYNGDTPWSACTNIRDVVVSLPNGLAACQLHQQHTLLDINRLSEAQLPDDNLAALLFRIERAADYDTVVSLMIECRTRLRHEPKLKLAFAKTFAALLCGQRGSVLTPDQVFQLMEVDMQVVGANLQRFTHKLREEARQEGEARMLQKQLAERFGPLQTSVVQRIEIATSEELERWGIQLLRAEVIEDVFRA